MRSKAGSWRLSLCANKLLRPLTLALCTAPSRQLSRPAQMAIQKLTAVMEAMRAVGESREPQP
ncbi:Uncharacterised protein [Raoultella terrigena]|uniref:Uncharacterized protein n=1 Tax=Raoultella terrigena TaxID=577 RepID=A0A3P8M4E1_RAOTE|nr:Uncharacterised protein [Raoultella terrigena]